MRSGCGGDNTVACRSRSAREMSGDAHRDFNGVISMGSDSIDFDPNYTGSIESDPIDSLDQSSLTPLIPYDPINSSTRR